MFEDLKKEVEYAKTSLTPRELLYQAYGRIKLACELELITSKEFFELNSMCVADGINNPKYFNRR